MTFDFKNASASERKAECKRIANEIGDDQFFTKKELDHLPSILFDGEQVIAFTSGFMDGNTWLITLTDKRVIFLDKGMLYGLKQAVIDLDKINAVSGETGLLLGSISIQDGATERTIKNVQKKTVINFTNKVRDAMEARKATKTVFAPNPHPAEPIDVISQLERLVSLKEKGVLSQEEFEQQKAKLDLSTPAVSISQANSDIFEPQLEQVHVAETVSANVATATRIYEQRKASTRLKLGIVLLPMVFAWFTLGTGYSKKARIFSFAWLLFTLILAGGSSDKQPSSTAKTTPVEQTMEQSSTDPEVEQVAEVDEPEVAVEVKPVVTFGMSPSVFTQKFNKLARKIDPAFSIGKLTIENGEANNTFKHMFSKSIGLVGVVDKDSGQVTSFMYLFSGSKDSSETLQAIITPLIISQIVNPEQKKETMSKLIMEMITNSIENLDSGKTIEHEVGSVKYSSAASKLTGLMLSIEPKST